jgi:hypothetical protein
MKIGRIRTSTHGRTKANFLDLLITLKLVVLEIATTILFCDWVYREVIHQLQR